MKATDTSGALRPIDDCYLVIPNYGTITVNNLPDISDSKNAVYNEDAIIGRSSPLHTYSHSATRQITVNFHFVITQSGDATDNLNDIRAIESCVYPREGPGDIPFVPPVICKFRCGNILAVEEDLCVILQNYSINFPTEVAWDEATFCPFKVDLNTSWWVVYTSEELPYSDRIITSGR